MRHRVKKIRLGRKSAPRKALLRNLVTSFIVNEKVVTTEAKAKALAPVFEELVTMVKNKDEMNAIRGLQKVVFGEEASRKMMSDIKGRFATRAGGFTRMRKVGFRNGDNAPLVRLEILSEETL